MAGPYWNTMLGFRRNRSMSSSISPADWNRSTGFFSMAFMVICSSPLGMEGFSSLGMTGLACSCISATDTALSAIKGSLPVSIS